MDNTTSEIIAPITPVTKQNFTLPHGQINAAALASRIADAWQTKFSTTTFGFAEMNTFSTAVEKFNNDILTKKDQLAKRKIQTGEMEETLDSIYKALKHLKAYIIETFGDKHGKEHFADFGIIIQDNYYSFPKDRDNLLVCLNATVNAMAATPDIANRTYGLAFWTDKRDKLFTQWRDATRMDNDLATITKSLQTQLPELETLVRRMKNQLKLDNPKDYKQTWREWGLQKEKF